MQSIIRLNYSKYSNNVEFSLLQIYFYLIKSYICIAQVK